MMDILKIENLNFSYSDRVIFDKLSFSLKEKTINSILGTNSSGKTTLIKLLSGILVCNKSIQLDNLDLTKRTFREYSKLIGVCFYNNFLFEDVVSELVFSLENLNYSDKDIKKRMEETSSLFEIKKLLNKKLNQLTELEKVKVAIASTIMHQPKIIFLDDIFENLKYEEYVEVSKCLNKIIQKYNITVLYTTNKLENCLLSDNVVFMDEGNIILHDTVEEILKKDNTLAKNGLIMPIMVDLSLKLQFYGLVDEVIMDVEGMVDKLWQ